MNQEKVGKFIAKLRKEKGLTQLELGERLGIGDKSVSKWERGIHAPDISHLNNLSEILGVTTTELLNGEMSNKEISVDTIQFYNKKTKRNYLKLFIGTVTFLIILFLLILLINDYNRYSVYQISSQNSNFVVNGCIIANHEMNIIIIKEIEYIDKYIGTDLEMRVKYVKLYLKCDNSILWSSDFNISENSLVGDNTYSLRQLILRNVLVLENQMFSLKSNNLDRLLLEVEYVDISNELNILIIPLNVQY